MPDVDEEWNPVQWVYAARNNLELEERYDQWAKRYDEDLEEDYGWLGPSLALEACKQYLPTDARILDAGAGTGLVGKMLAEAGFHRLTAIDMSPGMLEEARSKGVYRDLRRMVLGQGVGLPRRFLRCRSQYRRVDLGARPGPVVGRTCPGDQARWVRHIHPSSRPLRERRISRSTGGVGGRGPVGTGEYGGSRCRRFPRASRNCCTSYGSSGPLRRVEAEAPFARCRLGGHRTFML